MGIDSNIAALSQGPLQAKAPSSLSTACDTMHHTVGPLIFKPASLVNLCVGGILCHLQEKHCKDFFCLPSCFLSLFYTHIAFLLLNIRLNQILWWPSISLLTGISRFPHKIPCLSINPQHRLQISSLCLSYLHPHLQGSLYFLER